MSGNPPSSAAPLEAQTDALEQPIFPFPNLEITITPAEYPVVPTVKPADAPPAPSVHYAPSNVSDFAESAQFYGEKSYGSFAPNMPSIPGPTVDDQLLSRAPSNAISVKQGNPTIITRPVPPVVGDEDELWATANTLATTLIKGECEVMDGSLDSSLIFVSVMRRVNPERLT